jgi:DNA-directed RNA polymerase subunit RPC12/RpoP
MDFLSTELAFALAIGAVAFLAGILKLRGKGSRTRSVGHKPDELPANLRYICASCGGRFTHTRRTVAAWKNGARSFHCRSCHTRSLTVPKPKSFQLVPQAARKPGCLGVLVLLLALPAGLAATAWQHFT